MSDELDDISENVDDMIAHANSLIQSIYSGIDRSSTRRNNRRSGARNTGLLMGPPLVENLSQEIDGITRYCDSVDRTIQEINATVDEVQRATENAVNIATALMENTNRTTAGTARRNIPGSNSPASVIDLSNVSNVTRRSNENDDDVILVGTTPVIDLCTPIRNRTRRSRQSRSTVITSVDSPPPAISPSTQTSRENAAHERSTNETNYLSCPICLENSLTKRPTVTKCGHVFCESCIRAAIQHRSKCPLCNSKVFTRNLLRIYNH